jgi:hypothetical protein
VQINIAAKQIARERLRCKQETPSSRFHIRSWGATGLRLRRKQRGSIAIGSLVLLVSAIHARLRTSFLCRGMAFMSWSFPGMDNATKCRERAQRSKERAAAATNPETREHWQRVADAWHRAAEAAARTPPLIWEWERERWRDN